MMCAHELIHAPESSFPTSVNAGHRNAGLDLDRSLALHPRGRAATTAQPWNLRIGPSAASFPAASGTRVPS